MNAISALAAAFRSHPPEILPKYLPAVLHQPKQYLTVYELMQASTPYVICFAFGLVLIFYISERLRELKQIDQETKKENP